jgi:glycerol-3-phosphate dehydrogenase
LFLSGAGTVTGTVVYFTTRSVAASSVTGSSISKKDGYSLQRSDHVKLLQEANSTSTQFDILVIGGGATGCGSALDATTRGLRTAIIERGDLVPKHHLEVPN